MATLCVALTLTDCGKKEPTKELVEPQDVMVEDTTIIQKVDSVATSEVKDVNMVDAMVGQWSEPSGLQHHLVLKSDNTFEYQDFEKTKSGDLIDVMRQGTYTIKGSVVELKGEDGWQLSLQYDAHDQEAHLVSGTDLDFLKE